MYDSVSGDLGYTEDKTKNSAYASCSTVYCHSSGQSYTDPNDATPTYASPTWGGGEACGSCHKAETTHNFFGDTIDSGSHTSHIDNYSFNVGGSTSKKCTICHKWDAAQPFGACNQCHGTAGAITYHNNGEINVFLDTEFGPRTAYGDQTGVPGNGYYSCSNVYCHSTGQSLNGSSSTPVYTTPTWGNASSGACGTCHEVAVGSLTSGSHDVHLNATGVNGCGDCHTGAANDGSSYGNYTLHVNKSINVANTYSAGGAPGNGYGTCSAASCHDDGTGSPAVTPTWGSGGTGCDSCHAAAPTTGSHTKHLSGTQYDKAVCGDCHDGAVINTTAPAQHLDGNVDVYDASPLDLGYPQDVAKGGAPYDSCSAAYCHSTGQSTTNGSSSTPTYASITWGSSVSCGDCHAVAEGSGLTSGSHSAHLTSSVVSGCSDCHTGAADNASSYNSTNHVNASIEVANSYTDGGTPGNGYGTCSVAACHGGSTPEWGTDFTGIDECTKCHGTATASPAPDYAKAPPKDTAGQTPAADPQVGAHQAHLQSSLASDVACSQCHTVPANIESAGHIDDGTPGTAELTFGALASLGAASPVYSAGECSSVYCHGGAMPRGGTDGADETPVWSDTSYLSGSAANDCTRCHGYPPSGIAAHSGKGPTDCITCHNYGVNAAGTGFTDPSKHIDGTLDGGGDNCYDCHSSRGGPTPGTTADAAHAKHVQTVYVGKVSTGDYGNYTTNNWYYYANNGGVPDKGCGFCHPQSSASHMNGSIDLSFDPAEAGAAGTMKAKNNPTQSYTQVERTSVTCSSVYCHSSGYNDGSGYEYTTSPEWYAGSFVGDKCDDCHGNKPNTSSHVSHGWVGIHYDTIFDGTSGLLSATGASGAGHGDPATSTTINCYLCHNNVVKMAANDQNTACAVCHSGTPMGTMVIDPSATSHVTGTPDIDFADTIIRSKAQIRDDITTVTELNTYWQRNNGYKTGANSHDSSKQTLFNAASYDSGTQTCSTVSCHNGVDITWDTNINSCTACHIDVPRTDQ